MKKKKSWGGKRQNSGRKEKYGEETKVLSFRVPLSKIEVVKKMIENFLK